jgi:hypothetical protein
MKVSLINTWKCIATAAAMAVCATAWAQAPDASGMGTWKLDAAKSRFNPGPAPESLVTTFEPAGERVNWKSERRLPDGKLQTATYSAAYDGKEYPITGSPTADVVVLRRIDARTTERVNKKAGKVGTTEVRSVAADGKSYTTTVKGTTAKGEPIDHLMVFDKQ